jgi:hypothetical protein
VERAGTISRVLGRRTGTGTIRLERRDGPRRRVIVATAERDGIPIRTETVARYVAPPPLLLRAPKVSAAHRSGRVVLRWSRVAGAQRYLVELRTSDGARRLVERRGTSLSVPLNGRVSGTVAVRGLSRASTKPGRAGRVRLAALPAVSVVGSRSARAVARAGALVVRCVPGAAGVCSARVELRGRVVAQGARPAAYGRAALVRLRLKGAVRKHLAAGTVLRVVAAVPGDGRRVARVVLR